MRAQMDDAPNKSAKANTIAAGKSADEAGCVMRKDACGPREA